jgi:hypothetical protein
LERHAGLEELVSIRERFEFFIGCRHLLVAIAFALSALAIGDDLREETRPMVVDVRHQMLLIEAVHPGGELLRDMTVAEDLAYDRGVFLFSQGVVVAMP